MAGLYAPLPTLRSHPRGGLRTDRGRRGLLLLHRSGLSPHTPCRSPGALTRVAACTLARSPIVTANRRLQPFRYLHDCSDCFRLERIAGWASHPLESAAFSRRTPMAVFLASDAARDVTGQVFGTRMNEIYLFSSPRPIRSLHRADGWTPEAIAEHALPALQSSFMPLDRSGDVFSWDPL